MNELTPSIPAALTALDRMEKELTDADTYAAIRKVINQAKALKLLAGDVDSVKIRAENIILKAHQRIGQELQTLPKGNKHQTAQMGGLTKGTSGIPETSRRRYSTLATTPVKDVMAVAESLRKRGKDATFRAVSDELKYGDKKQRRETRQKALGDKIKALPVKKYGIIYADPGTKFQTRSDKGLDRSADNHYTTQELNDILKLDVASLAFDDCILLLWSTAPMMMQSGEILKAWGFTYKSMLVWDKEVAATGYLFLNQIEVLIYATRGNPVAPGEKHIISSLYRERKTTHSTKPWAIARWIEETWPNTPKIELFRRGPARAGWDAWGNESETETEQETDNADEYDPTTPEA